MFKIDLTNKQFDYYRVIGKNIDKSKNSKNTWWNCQCKCGKFLLLLQLILINKKLNLVDV